MCVFVFHRAFTMQAWRALENESALITAQYEYDPRSLNALDMEDPHPRDSDLPPAGRCSMSPPTPDEQSEMENPSLPARSPGGFLPAAVGRTSATSATTGYETYYYAVLLSDGNVPAHQSGRRDHLGPLRSGIAGHPDRLPCHHGLARPFWPECSPAAWSAPC